MAGERTIGWKLDRDQRQGLLARFPPTFERPIADHVTLWSDVDEGVDLPELVEAQIIGRATDGRGVEAMVVAVDGSPARPDGSTFHITWSLADGRGPEESNDVIAERGWDLVDPPVLLRLHPARFE